MCESTRAQGKEIHPKKKHRRSKARAKEIPKVIPREKGGKSKGQTKKMERVQKNVVSPGKTGWKNTGKGGKKNTRKSGSKEKNNGDENGGVLAREYRTCGQVCRHGWHIIFA